MEANQFDLMEEVEKVVDDTPKAPELKEYEKLLLAERDRKDFERAENLVTFGCFAQKQEPVVDFNNYEKINVGKKYKKLYDLYRNKDTFELVFICPLVEDNKGDVDEKVDMTPYSYDCLVVETMDAETYEMVCKAAKNNISNSVSKLYTTSWVIYYVYLAFVLVFYGYNFVTSVSNGFMAAVFGSLYYAAPLIAGAVIALPILALLQIKYKKYKAQ